jgi:hypothetical protein
MYRWLPYRCPIVDSEVLRIADFPDTRSRRHGDHERRSAASVELRHFIFTAETAAVRHTVSSFSDMMPNTATASTEKVIRPSRAVHHSMIRSSGLKRLYIASRQGRRSTRLQRRHNVEGNDRTSISCLVGGPMRAAFF